MNQRAWKRVQPTSLRDAFVKCKDYARDAQNLSVERIAELMGLADQHSLYKWLANGRMPAVLIPAYERVCGIDFVSRWFVVSSGKLVINVPTGRTAGAEDTQNLQAVLTSATGALIEFYAGRAKAEEVLAAVQAGLEALAYHRGNVAAHSTPQLELQP